MDDVQLRPEAPSKIRGEPERVRVAIGTLDAAHERPQRHRGERRADRGRCDDHGAGGNAHEGARHPAEHGVAELVQTARADRHQLGIIGLREVNQGLGRIAAAEGDTSAFRQAMLVDGRAQPSDFVPDPDADRPAMSGRPRCTQDMHQYRFAPQIACQLSTGRGGALAAGRVVDPDDDVMVHALRQPVLFARDDEGPAAPCGAFGLSLVTPPSVGGADQETTSSIEYPLDD